MAKLITDYEIKELITDKGRVNYSFNLDEKVLKTIDEFIAESNEFNRRFDYIRTVLINFIFHLYENEQDWSESKNMKNVSHLFKVKKPMVKINAAFKSQEMKLIEKMRKYFWFDLRAQFMRFVIINDLKERGLL